MVITYFKRVNSLQMGLLFFYYGLFVIIIMYQKLLPKLFLGAMFAL